MGRRKGRGGGEKGRRREGEEERGGGRERGGREEGERREREGAMQVAQELEESFFTRQDHQLIQDV